MIFASLFLAAGVVNAFTPTAYTSRAATALSIGGSFLEEPRDLKTFSDDDDEEYDSRDYNPKTNFQKWIKKWDIDHRRGTTGNLLVSGNRLIDQFMDQKGGDDSDTFADPEILYMLMEEQYTFEFDKIYICAYDMDDAKKRLISRKARYTGLLDKLEFIESDFGWDDDHPEVFSIPTAEQMKKYGITNWLYLQDNDHVFLCEKAYEVANDCRDQLNNVVMTFMDYYEDEKTTIPLLDKTWNTLGGPRHSKILNPKLEEADRYLPDDVQYTFLVCATPTNEPEGGSDWTYDDLLVSSEEDIRLAKEGGYLFLDEERLEKIGYSGASITQGWDRISQRQMYRFTVDALDLACFSGRALHFRDAWDPLFKRLQKPNKAVITGMREGGFTSTEIMAHIFDYFVDYQYRWDMRRWNLKGQGFRAGKMRKNWWTAPEYQESFQTRALGEESVTQVRAEANRRAMEGYTETDLEIQKIAIDWAMRQYYKASTSGTLEENMDEESFIDSVWEEAMDIAEEKYAKLKDVADDDYKAYTDDKSMRKQSVIAQKAEAELASIIGAPTLQGETDDTLDEYDDIVKEEQAQQEAKDEKGGDDEDEK